MTQIDEIIKECELYYEGQKGNTMDACEIYPRNPIRHIQHAKIFAKAIFVYAYNEECADITEIHRLYCEEDESFSLADMHSEPWQWEHNISFKQITDLIWKHRRHLYLPPDMEIHIPQSQWQTNQDMAV